jgi:hypothetical protein
MMIRWENILKCWINVLAILIVLVIDVGNPGCHEPTMTADG